MVELTHTQRDYKSLRDFCSLATLQGIHSERGLRQMTIDKAQRTQPGKILSLFRRGSQWQKIDGYRVEDLNSEQPVWVTADSTMLGNIIAPEIRIDGMVHGAAVSQSITIVEGGQIWGNLYTASLQIEPGGAVYGWTSSIDEAQFVTIQSLGSLPDNWSASAVPPAAAGGSDLAAQDPAYMDAFNRLRQEAASAKAARAELEHTFDKRLSEVAGETAARVVSLREELATTRSTLTAVQQRAADLESNLEASRQQVERQTEALATNRALLEQQTEELQKNQESYEAKSAAYDQLYTSYRALDANFIAAQQQIDRLENKIDSLESALQNNLQHSAEQESSLIHWQELAEDYQKQIADLDSKLQSSDYQAVEHSRVIDMLRAQRDQLEEEWQQAQEELLLLRERDTRLLSKEELKKEQSLAEAFEAAQHEIVELKTAVSKLSKYEDQALWYEADLETARVELQETRAALGKQATRLTHLQEELETTRATTAAKDAEIDQLNQRLDKQIQHAHALEQRLNQEAEVKGVDRRTTQKSIQKLQLQLEAAEMELERHLEETSRQGQHLAEIQATLAEREIKIKQLKKTAVARAQTITELTEAARQRVESLEAKLTHSQEQVNELKSFIERKHKKRNG